MDETQTEIADLKAQVAILLTRIEDLENIQLNVPQRIVLLTPSDTLEDTKGRLNSVISIINELSIN